MGGRPFLGTAKKQKISSNKRSAIIKEIRENLEKEKSGTVACYNHYIVFCEQRKLDPHDARNLRAFRKKALDKYIAYGSKFPKSTYKYRTKRISTPPDFYAPPEAVELVPLSVQLFDSPIHGKGVRILEDADDGMHIMFLEGAFRKKMCHKKSYLDGAPHTNFDSAAEINGRLVQIGSFG
jgi:hypothetical protein